MLKKKDRYKSSDDKSDIQGYICSARVVIKSTSDISMIKIANMVSIIRIYLLDRNKKISCVLFTSHMGKF